jgi:ATP-dependent protease ClpP protease subunit
LEAEHLKQILNAAALAFFLSASSSNAEQHREYHPFFYHEEDLSTIFLDGAIDSMILWRFANLLDNVPNVTTIVLNSPGGEVYSALILAKQIERMGLHTVVMGQCHSACAFLYFAGANRTVAAGTVGVHQISSTSQDMVSGQMTLADILELMETYSVPADVIVEMLRTAPEDMRIYDHDQLDALGLTGPRSTPDSVGVSGPSDKQNIPTDPLKLPDGDYAGITPYGGTLSLRIDGQHGAVAISAPGCTGSMYGLVRRLETIAGIASATCFISIKGGQSGHLNLIQGRGCNGHHGFRCSLEGTVKRGE